MKYRILIRLYWFLWHLDLKFSGFREENSRYYDNYGVIDTLGHSYSFGRFTTSYHDELTSISYINLICGYKIALYDNYGENIAEIVKF